ADQPDLGQSFAERLSSPACDHPAVVSDPRQTADHHAKTDDHRYDRALGVRNRSTGLGQLDYPDQVAGQKDDQANICRSLVDQSRLHATAPIGWDKISRKKWIARLRGR